MIGPDSFEQDGRGQRAFIHRSLSSSYNFTRGHYSSLEKDIQAAYKSSQPEVVICVLVRHECSYTSQRLRGVVAIVPLAHVCAAFGDLRLNPEDRAEARIKLEFFILEHGTPLLRQVERTFNVSDASLPENLLAAEWFVVFASGLDEAWIRDLDLGTLRRFWYAFEHRRLRARVVRLMATVEFVRDHLGNNAVYSEIVRLYGHGKQDAWTADLNPERREILEILFTIAKRTEPQRLGSGSLGTYVLRVIRFCMTDNNRKVADAEIQMMLGFAGELPADYRHQFDVVWRLALPRFS